MVEHVKTCLGVSSGKIVIFLSLGGETEAHRAISSGRGHVARAVTPGMLWHAKRLGPSSYSSLCCVPSDYPTKLLLLLLGAWLSC